MVRILSVDPSMANTGYWIGDLSIMSDPAECRYRSSWTDKSGMETHETLTEVERGTISTASSEPFWERLQTCADGIKTLIRIYRPQILCSEGILSHGQGRNPSGTAVLALILDQFRPTPHPFSEGLPLPETVVTITPPKLFSIAHWGRKTPQGQKITKAVIKSRYREVRKQPAVRGDRLTDHEADAYFCAYHASRFWATLVNPAWSTSILTSKEIKAFQTSVGQNPRTGAKHSTALIDEVRVHWWNVGSQTQTYGSEVRT